MPELAENVFQEEKRSHPPRRAVRLDLDPSSAATRLGVVAARDDEMLALRGLGALGALEVRDLVAHPRRYCSVITWKRGSAVPSIASALDINYEVTFIADVWSAGSVSTVPTAVPERLVAEPNADEAAADSEVKCLPDEDVWGLRQYRLAKAARAFLGEDE